MGTTRRTWWLPHLDRTTLIDLSCLRAARENARSVREVISSEMWEQVAHFT
jgi:uncharacterized alpha-E superfamily protein